MNAHTEKGSTLSQEMGAPHDVGRTFSGRDSGINTSIKSISSNAMAVASHTTKLSLYRFPRYAPMAGLVTRLAAKVADTCTQK